MADPKLYAKLERAIRHHASKLAKREHERRERLDKVAEVRGKLYAH
jgi:hypothetical protein